MNPLLKKEIRLVLPAWLAILTLGLFLPWFGHDQEAPIVIAPVFFLLGMVLLAVDSFGREFSLGTFSSLMAQPLNRQRMWRTKLSVLLAAAILVFAFFFLSCEVRFAGRLAVWHTFGSTMTECGVVLLVALAGGLWAALLLRQTAAAFWIALLAPVGLLMLIVFGTTFLFKSTADWFDEAVLYIAAGLYIPAAFWFAHRLFFRAEDGGWTGGVISFSKWRYFENTRPVVESQRRRRPLAALLKKEFQLHSISLFGAGVLLGLQGLVYFLRANYSNYHRNSLAETITDCFWFLWLIIPLVTGCMAVAEERKLAVTDGQRCLPVAPWRQYLLKLSAVMFLGVLLGGVMPLLLESAAAGFGEPGAFFKDESHYPLTSTFFAGAAHPPVIWFRIAIVGLAAALAWVGFFASTLARNFLQALSMAMLMTIGGGLFYTLLLWLGDQHAAIFGLLPIPWLLGFLIGIPTLAGTFFWLGCRNFIDWQETGRMWRRMAAAPLWAGLFIAVSSNLIYDRAWEVFEPAEPSHGAAKFTLANAPRLQGGENFSDLQVRLPDGRLWCDTLANFYSAYLNHSWKQVWMFLVDRMPISGGPQAYVGGSNWISVAAGHVDFLTWQTNLSGSLDTVGVRADGTLWISRDSRPHVWTGAQMVQFGTAINWRQVVEDGVNFLLLKSDGTFWQWGTNHIDYNQWQTNWPTVRNIQPRQIGTNSDWQEIFPAWPGYARKRDGSVWGFISEGKGLDFKFARRNDMASVDPKTYEGTAYIGQDGSLWLRRNFYDFWAGGQEAGFSRVGGEKNWLSVATTRSRMVALRNDGTLWQWNLSPGKSVDDIVATSPKPLGIHNDWVALDPAFGGTISLAADGSLWLWPELDYQHEQQPLVRLPKQPKLLGNVLAAN